MSHTLDHLRIDACAILRAAVEAADASPLVAAALARHPVPTLAPHDTIRLVAAGKAAWPMAQAALAFLGERVTAGIITGPRGGGDLPRHVDWIDGAHPLPDALSLRAAARALEVAREARRSGDLLLVLLSGGASAMLALPAAGVSLDDKQQTTAALLRAGASIAELNCVRKHLSAIKGGQLALAAGRCHTLALSDVHVPEDDPATIASGPTVSDGTTYADAIDVLDQRRCRVPGPVRTHLERGAAGSVGETPKPGDPRLASSTFEIVGNRHAAMDGAVLEARRRGYAVRVVDPPTMGEARDAGRRLVEAALSAGPPAGPTCLVASGETTVTVRGGGLGGRNQEFVLGAAAALARDWRLALVASAGTDGVDGPTDASGGIASSTTLLRASALGLDVGEVLERNDAYTLLARLDDLIRWAPTLTNVGDVHVVLTMGA